ncbi:hypothetical protein Q428_11130 [Fervidicella metallireducens AeB]|uniref:NAD(+) diphosphatase n=1 Tax=Fervidicella metallireducens AeB TaxID=1403537 RepID=A0A017RTS2_9CLOT|nr:NAD(+) diphosphatase [Fervidicella metallireducens]EYE87859.1 hypothetical protein Q428_11130 [Fervidicella metallireducens AeB]
MLDNYISFIPECILDCKRVEENDTWLIFSNNKIMYRLKNNEIIFPKSTEIKNLELINILGIGHNSKERYYVAELKDESFVNEFTFNDLKSLVGVLEEELFFICSRAAQMLNWNKNNVYCGRCGSLMDFKSDDTAKFCPKCGQTMYPRISPAVIVAIVKEDKILLAHNVNFQQNRYSTIAGFVEVGETFEECVKREVYEEVGVKVKNIKYFASQPWPFPDSLMVAFTAEYDSGDIKVDGKEISHADWFNKANLPNIPVRGSVARKLIDWFISSI